MILFAVKEFNTGSDVVAICMAISTDGGSLQGIISNVQVFYTIK